MFKNRVLPIVLVRKQPMLPAMIRFDNCSLKYASITAVCIYVGGNFAFIFNIERNKTGPIKDMFVFAPSCVYSTV
ncbi:hypothetical protein AT251_24435 [Enterovibrio nigricans]|nr:hypothetical protein AT251_24435 [Enterovibrio nigricans]